MLNSSSHSKVIFAVKQTYMAADCGDSTIKSVVGKTAPSNPPTLVNASKGKSIKNSKESRKYGDAVVERSVSPLRPFQLAIKENVSYKPLAAVNTIVKKPERITSAVKKPETAIPKSFSRPTPEIRHRGVLNHSVRNFV